MGTPGTQLSLQSLNFPDHYIAIENYGGVLLVPSSDQLKKDSTFTIVEGLVDGLPNDPENGLQAISFQSIEFPNYYLRHSNFIIYLQESDGTDIFNQDATFWREVGNEDPLDGGCVSFRSVNYPSRFIRHSNFIILVEMGDDDGFKNDSTFMMTLPNWLPAGI